EFNQKEFTFKPEVLDPLEQSELDAYFTDCTEFRIGELNGKYDILNRCSNPALISIGFRTLAALHCEELFIHMFNINDFENDFTEDFLQQLPQQVLNGLPQERIARIQNVALLKKLTPQQMAHITGGQLKRISDSKLLVLIWDANEDLRNEFSLWQSFLVSTYRLMHTQTTRQKVLLSIAVVVGVAALAALVLGILAISGVMPFAPALIFGLSVAYFFFAGSGLLSLLAYVLCRYNVANIVAMGAIVGGFDAPVRFQT
ncbi:MAG: hypothetical protein LBC42_01395, partial [Puniceicoccales bacterium]|nr:hypothetical protein [Puniceicoccales bacterium]